MIRFLDPLVGRLGVKGFEVEERTLHFKRPATTSRGSYLTHHMYLVHLLDASGKRVGTGECAPLPDLSSDRNAYPDSETVAALLATAFRTKDFRASLRSCPALLFAVESALEAAVPSSPLYTTPFAEGREGIPMNGLIWMADYDTMLKELETKIEQGFRCIKIKIGAIQFQKELELIHIIRSSYDARQMEIRVDANGNFSPDDVMGKLETLAQLQVHSIEQPIAPGQWKRMAELCKASPVPIALDEELIGWYEPAQKEALLAALRPRYIVLKPTLHGGVSGVREWVRLARRHEVKSWITSALESNVGLQTVALLAALEYGPCVTFPQGLGTGELFTDNVLSAICRKGSEIWRRVDEQRTVR